MGKARGDLPSVPSCGPEMGEGVEKGLEKALLFPLLCKKKKKCIFFFNALESQVSPGSSLSPAWPGRAVRCCAMRCALCRGPEQTWGPGWRGVAGTACSRGRRRWAIAGGVGGSERPGEAQAAAAARSRGCRAALGPLSVCWQEAPAHAVLVNIQTRDFSQSKSTSTFFENLPKNSKRREFLAPSPCRWAL